MNEYDIPVVIPERCTACNDCVEVCPKDLFTLMPMDHKLLVQCKSLLEGDEAEALCGVACNACGRCALDAAPGVVEMVNGLAVVDYDKNDMAGPETIRTIWPGPRRSSGVPRVLSSGAKEHSSSLRPT
jgi:ferredoxin